MSTDRARPANAGYHRAIAHAPLPLPHRLRMHAGVMKLLYWRRRDLWQEALAWFGLSQDRADS